MTNVLDNIIANQPIRPAKQAPLPAFTFNAEGKIKPLDDKAKLLPSRIFGSPIEYVKDLKQDGFKVGIRILSSTRTEVRLQLSSFREVRSVRAIPLSAAP